MLSDRPDATTWITGGVELPNRVMEALQDGTLVLFVGAGASVASPSGLPLFEDLARQLAGLARVDFDPKKAVDASLGSMPKTFETHRHARDLIARTDSRPNSTHAALVRLATAAGRPRIVTTNFDDHLSTAASAAGGELVDKWIGPALPLGGDFVGLVHLHGSMLREPNGLVLTDSDFGKAYLTHAWATRFLLPMFASYTVVFIGYSHNDPLMRYLALGLPSQTPRYAFTSDSESSDEKWIRLGVTPISYPAPNGDHSALVAALEAWDVRARMVKAEHQVRVREIVEPGPRMTPVDRDYLLGRLETVEGAREFVQAVSALSNGRKLDWLHWLEDLPAFKTLFSGGPDQGATSVFSWWFCQEFVADPDLNGAALQTVQRMGQAFTSVLFTAATWAADELSKKDRSAGRRWKAFLATSVIGRSAPAGLDALLPFQAGEEAEDLALLRAALRPGLNLKRRWLLDETEAARAMPDAEIHWTPNADSLTEHLAKVVDARSPGDPAVGAMLEDALSSAYDLLEAYHGESRSDAMSFRRSAIETHPQDQLRETPDALIDALRVYGERAFAVRPDLPERWWLLGRALYQRLALHVIATNDSQTPDEKIAWLLERSALYQYEVKHEAYQLLAKAVNGASEEECRHRLLEAVYLGPSLKDDLPNHDRHTAYVVYNLLVWLSRCAPSWLEVASALDSVQQANPSFAPREAPDFDTWMTVGIWGGTPPMEPEEFIRSFEQDPAAALDKRLLTRDYTEREFDQPEWRDALGLIRRVAAARQGHWRRDVDSYGTAERLAEP